MTSLQTSNTPHNVSSRPSATPTPRPPSSSSMPWTSWTTNPRLSRSPGFPRSWLHPSAVSSLWSRAPLVIVHWPPELWHPGSWSLLIWDRNVKRYCFLQPERSYSSRTLAVRVVSSQPLCLRQRVTWYVIWKPQVGLRYCATAVVCLVKNWYCQPLINYLNPMWASFMTPYDVSIYEIRNYFHSCATYPTFRLDQRHEMLYFRSACVCFSYDFLRWIPGVVMLPTLSSPAGPLVIGMTIPGTISIDEMGVMARLGIQCNR